MEAKLHRAQGGVRQHWSCGAVVSCEQAQLACAEPTLEPREHAASRTDGNAEPDSSAALGASFHTPAVHAPVSLPPAAPGAGIQRA